MTLSAIPMAFANNGTAPWFVNCGSTCMHETGWVNVECCTTLRQIATPYWLVSTVDSPSLSVSLNWGDGRVETSLIQGSLWQCTLGDGSCYSFSIYGHHTYTSTGTFTQQTTVTDSSGLSASTTSTFLIFCCPPVTIINATLGGRAPPRR